MSHCETWAGGDGGCRGWNGGRRPCVLSASGTHGMWGRPVSTVFLSRQPSVQSTETTISPRDACVLEPGIVSLSTGNHCSGQLECVDHCLLRSPEQRAYVCRRYGQSSAQPIKPARELMTLTRAAQMEADDTLILRKRNGGSTSTDWQSCRHGWRGGCRDDGSSSGLGNTALKLRKARLLEAFRGHKPPTPHRSSSLSSTVAKQAKLHHKVALES